MVSNKKNLLLLLFVGFVSTAVFAQGPPPPPAVPLDGGITAIVAFLTAGIIKVWNDKRKNSAE